MPAPTPRPTAAQPFTLPFPLTATQLRSLTRLGWDDTWSAALTAELTDPPHGSAPTARTVGRVCRADRAACEVLVPAPPGLTTVTAAWATGLERSAAADPTAVPAAGDWVVLHGPCHGVGSDPAPSAGHRVERVLPRRTAVVRAQVARGSSHGQVLAANADVVAVVEGMVPDLDLAKLERLLALAWSSGARPVVLLTKADLVPDPSTVVADVARTAPGVDVLPTSATTGAGLDPLRAWLAEGATIALVGASGVGKSTLLNALVAEADGVGPMATRSLGAEGKGRHTTVTRELHLGPRGGAVLDTPGLRTVGLAGETGVDEVFPEIEELALGCRFADCAHRTEPSCAVLAAIDAGELPERRLLSYRKLLREASYQATRTDARLRAAEAGRVKAQQRSYRRYPTRP